MLSAPLEPPSRASLPEVPCICGYCKACRSTVAPRRADVDRDRWQQAGKARWRRRPRSLSVQPKPACSESCACLERSTGISTTHHNRVSTTTTTTTTISSKLRRLDQCFSPSTKKDGRRRKKKFAPTLDAGDWLVATLARSVLQGSSSFAPSFLPWFMVRATGPAYDRASPTSG